MMQMGRSWIFDHPPGTSKYFFLSFVITNESIPCTLVHCPRSRPSRRCSVFYAQILPDQGEINRKKRSLNLVVRSSYAEPVLVTSSSFFF